MSESTRKKTRKYPCFTSEEQGLYDGLLPRQQAYVDGRASGLERKEAYIRAGYGEKDAARKAYIMETRGSGVIKQLVERVTAPELRALADINKENSKLNAEIDKKAREAYKELGKTKNGYTEVVQMKEAMVDVPKMDAPTAERLAFYRDIMNGKTKSVKETIRYNKDGEVIERKIEKINDVDTRIRARKEVDRILGLNTLIDVGELQAGKNITINIVDASKPKEIPIEPEDVKVVDDDERGA